MAHFGDRHGRKRIFAFSVLLMALPTLAIGFLPTYESIGIAAPLLLLGMRLLQGIAIGARHLARGSFSPSTPLHNEWAGSGVADQRFNSWNSAWFPGIKGCGNAALAPLIMVRAFPAEIRFSGVSFSYNLTYAAFGGVPPPLTIWMAHLNPVGPAHYVALAALGGLIGILLTPQASA